MMSGEGTKRSYIYREGNQGSDGVRVSLKTHVLMVTIVRHNEQRWSQGHTDDAHVRVMVTGV